MVLLTGNGDLLLYSDTLFDRKLRRGRDEARSVLLHSAGYGAKNVYVKL